MYHIIPHHIISYHMLSHYKPLIIGYISIFPDHTHESSYTKHTRIIKYINILVLKNCGYHKIRGRRAEMIHKCEYHVIKSSCQPRSSVGIATDYGLDGSGANPGGDEIFRSSRPALGPTQPPV